MMENLKMIWDMDWRIYNIRMEMNIMRIKDNTKHLKGVLKFKTGDIYDG